ncbi:MAG: aminopeptidase [Solirubrobacterales bacterium]|jgi:aminopeptidase|nr:aminopeptidase [Solirubrobacterales bacterium]
MSPFDDPATLERFARLAVGFAANVQPGQLVQVKTEIGKEAVTRAIATEAYRAGAKFVDVEWFDLHVKRARLEYAAEDTLDWVPEWMGAKLMALSDARAARIALSGPVAPHLLDGIDPARSGKDQLPALKETGPVVNARTTNWTILPCPTRPWAEEVHPDLSPDEAWTRLGEQLLHVCRLDEEDPVAAWKRRAAVLVGAAARVRDRRFDAIRFRGEGTDLRVGLLPSSEWIAAQFETIDGIAHMPNLPSEEVFCSPDPERVDGVVRATKPLVLGGNVIRGLEVEFRDGVAVRIDAEQGAEVLRGYAAKDPGAARLGEVALVDGDGRIGKLDTVFFDTLLDENAASHIALGNAYSFGAGEADQERLNRSAIHVDFMIGSDAMEVDGLDAAGEATPVLRGGAWQL